MLPRNRPLADLIGRKATLDVAACNVGGRAIAKGSVVTIRRAEGPHIEVESMPCPHCGQHVRVHGLRRVDLTLVEEGEK